MKFLFQLLVLFSLSIFGQEPPKTFPKAVEENIMHYNAYSTVAHNKGDFEKGKYIFDTLVSNQLVGTKFEDYTFRKIYGGKLKLSSIKKPILIQTFSSWCVLNRGEAVAINKLAKKYRKQIQIVLLFWDKKQNAKDVAGQFNGFIEVCYANELSNKDEKMVATMKYAIGFLTSYYIDEKLTVVTVKKGSAKALPKKAPMKDCVQNNTDYFEPNLVELIAKSQIVKQ